MNLINGVSFREWSNSANARRSYVISHNSYRDVYQFPDGTIVYMDTQFPAFVGDISIKVTIEWNAPRTEENMALVKRYGGRAETAPYAQNNEIEFCFYGNDAMEKTWRFVADNRSRFIVSKQ